ncbi:MAG: DUF6455 family protein [Stellaceae bacterium]
MTQSFEETRSEAPHGLLRLIGSCTSRVARVIGEARDRAALRAEFAHLRETGQLERVLGDIGVDPAEVPTLIRNHPGAPRRLAAMLRYLRIEATKEGRSSLEMRTIERTCSLCEASGKCDNWLRSDGSEDPATFCPNTQAFHELVTSGKATQRHDA